MASTYLQNTILDLSEKLDRPLSDIVGILLDMDRPLWLRFLAGNLDGDWEEMWKIVELGLWEINRDTLILERTNIGKLILAIAGIDPIEEIK